MIPPAYRYCLLAILAIMGVNLILISPRALAASPVVRLTIEPHEALSPRTPAPSFFSRLVQLLGARRPIAPVPIGTVLTMDATAYAPSPYQTDSTPCITAAGTRTRPGVVATNALPFGTILEIQTGTLKGKKLIVEDRMHPRFQNTLDVWFASTSEALAFGRERQIKVVVQGYGKPGESLEPLVPKEELTTTEVPEESQAVGRWEQMKSAVKGFSFFLRAQLDSKQNAYDVDCYAED